MFKPASQKDITRYDRAVDSAIATCGGDLRGALKALIIANEYLEDELRQSHSGNLAGFSITTNTLPQRRIA